MTGRLDPDAGSEERYRQILETAPDAMVIVGSDGKIIYANRQTENLFGYSAEDLTGKPLEILIPQRFHGAHAGHLARYFANPSMRPMGSGLALFGRRANGEEMAIEVSLSPVRTSGGFWVSAAIRDISERKRIEAEVQLNADRLASAVESIEEALALFDAEHRLVLCNSVYRRVVGEATPGALVGRSFDDVFGAWLGGMAFASEEERSQFVADKLADRREARTAFDVRTRDERSFRITNRRTLEGGIVQTIWDLTDDVRREQELREARTAAEAGSAAKSEFLSSMSHELRTPLNAILGFAQLLQRDRKEPLSERHKERADQILKGGEHLLRLINDILDLSRIEAGGVSISTEAVSVAEVLDEVTRTLAPMAAREGIRVELAELPAELPPVAVDRTRFAQILMNYGSNAIKYNRRGGSVSLRVSTERGDFVRIVVADTGVGIALDKQDKLFQPFQRAGQETGPIEGTGIGLVITKRLAELMGGAVGFRSEPGKGSEFWVDVPTRVAVATVETLPIPSLAPGSQLGGAEGRRLVLYVEDNPANVTFMRDLLSGFDGLTLVTAPTAEMGLELARSRVPDVVIMDINLPGMSGLDALRALKALPETRRIPVIALTAAASDRDRQRGEQAGFYRYLTKPVKVDELEAALESLLVTSAS